MTAPPAPTAWVGLFAGAALIATGCIFGFRAQVPQATIFAVLGILLLLASMGLLRRFSLKLSKDSLEAEAELNDAVRLDTSGNPQNSSALILAPKNVEARFNGLKAANPNIEAELGAAIEAKAGLVWENRNRFYRVTSLSSGEIAVYRFLSPEESPSGPPQLTALLIAVAPAGAIRVADG